MRLSKFITSNSESILAEFEEFARTHTAAGETMNVGALRDHAAAILKVIAADIDEPQSQAEQERKSKGDAPVLDDVPPTASEKHGADRADSGFTLAEMFSEYRALRASVIRLWTRECRQLRNADIDELIRFNESIDESLAESIAKYSSSIESSREMFLAILGHDLRSPLGAVVSAADLLLTDGDLTGLNQKMASVVHSSGHRMLDLVSDLLDFTRARLGQGIPVIRSETDLSDVTRQAVDEVRTRHPGRKFDLEMRGNLKGQWDSARIGQVLSNLIENADQHGAPDTPVKVATSATSGEVVITVRNKGPAISPEDQGKIFDPFKRLSAGTTPPTDATASIGLGLYIAKEIAAAHGGWITVESTEKEGTTFELHLPRVPD